MEKCKKHLITLFLKNYYVHSLFRGKPGDQGDKGAQGEPGVSGSFNIDIKGDRGIPGIQGERGK